MSRGRRLADGVAALSLVLLVTAEVVTVRVEPEKLLENVLSGVAFVVGFGGVGWLLWRRIPANPVGWCFSLAALVGALTSTSHAWAVLAADRHRRPDLVLRLAAVVDAHSWVLGVPLALVLPLFLLPDGRLPSRRWRPVLAAVLVGSALGAIGFLAAPGPIEAVLYPALVNPLGVAAGGPALGVFRTIGGATLTAGTLAGAVAVVVRFRRSHGVERQQLRWVALGGSCAAVGSAFGSAAGQVLPDGFVVLFAVGLFAVPVCVGVAVLRYRLYDLGRVVSRTVSYALVTAIVLGVYLGVVTAAAQLSPGTSSVAVAASTLAAAAVFQPLRLRVQRIVDARFNRAKYDAERTVEDFRRRLRDEVDLVAVRADLLQVVDGTVQPAVVGLWLREGAT